MTKLGERQSLIGLIVLCFLAVSCGNDLAAAVPDPPVVTSQPTTTQPPVATSVLEVNEITGEGLTKPGEPVVLWFWSPD